jgi:hypothetical protein
VKPPASLPSECSARTHVETAASAVSGAKRRPCRTHTPVRCFDFDLALDPELARPTAAADPFQNLSSRAKRDIGEANEGPEALDNFKRPGAAILQAPAKKKKKKALEKLLSGTRL